MRDRLCWTEWPRGRRLEPLAPEPNVTRPSGNELERAAIRRPVPWQKAVLAHTYGGIFRAASQGCNVDFCLLTRPLVVSHLGSIRGYRRSALKGRRDGDGCLVSGSQVFHPDIKIACSI